MCLPLAALPLVAAGMSAAGSLYGGIQANQQGKAEAAVAERNAQMEVDAAHQSVEIGQGERRDFWREIAQTKGQQQASMAANGLDLSFGTPLNIEWDTTDLANEDASNLYRNIEDRTRGRLINASNYTAEAKAARQKGKAALIGSVFEAGTSLMSGFQQFKGIGAKSATGTSYAKNG
jgi:hypothetical protein